VADLERLQMLPLRRADESGDARLPQLRGEEGKTMSKKKGGQHSHKTPVKVAQASIGKAHGKAEMPPHPEPTNTFGHGTGHLKGKWTKP
jgi:hypothetical protein